VHCFRHKIKTYSFCAISLVGCQVIGPGAIQHGRINYNSVLERTNQDQTFINILRVKWHQSTAFMDVSEIDAVVLSQGSIMGGLNPAGGPTQLGNVSGTAEYQESPTIRYSPVLGQNLVSQVSTPISVESIANMINSGWPVSAVLDFACDRLTPGPYDRGDALAAIERLFDEDIILIGTGKAQDSKSGAQTGAKTEKSENQAGGVSVQVVQNNSGGDSGSSGGGAKADSLVLFLNPIALKYKPSERGLWDKLQRLYEGTQNGTPPNQIFLRTISSQPIRIAAEFQGVPGPVMQTRSALGVLKTAISPEYQRIYFVSPEQYETYRSEIRRGVLRYGNRTQLMYFNPDRGDTQVHRLLIIHSRSAPSSKPYVRYFDTKSGEYFYIAGDDEISQDCFVLLNLFLTIQAAPPPAPLTPTISVGSKGGS
jgi:hypothetical protein